MNILIVNLTKNKKISKKYLEYKSLINKVSQINNSI